IGETSKLLILVVGLYLAYRKVLDWKVPAVYIGSVFVFTTIVALTNGVGMWYPMFHIVSGGLIFGAVFMATDPVTNPTTISGRIIFAIGLAILTVLIRLKANLPEGVVYAILIMNMISPLLDKLTDGWSIYSVKKHTIAICTTFVLGLIITVFAGSTLEPKAVVLEGGAEDIEITLGSPVKIFSDDTANLPEVLERTEDGSIVTFKMSTPGYLAIEHDGKPNTVEVKLNTETKTVESVLVTEAVDTPNLGENVKAKSFVDQFSGISFTDTEATVDIVSGATISSKAVAKAVRIAIEELNK
ncbi:MAG: RnfABCDGE type electron transport complex subunit D, partial [Clostridiaceae bacterium]